jgi:hypothetical protein
MLVQIIEWNFHTHFCHAKQQRELSFCNQLTMLKYYKKKILAYLTAPQISLFLISPNDLLFSFFFSPMKRNKINGYYFKKYNYAAYWVQPSHTTGQ